MQLWNQYYLSLEQISVFSTIVSISQDSPERSNYTFFFVPSITGPRQSSEACTLYNVDWTYWSGHILDQWAILDINMEYGIMITLWIWKDKHMWWVMHIWMCICWVCTWWVCTCWMCIWCRSTTWWVCKWIHLCKMPASRSQGPWWWKWWRRWSN